MPANFFRDNADLVHHFQSLDLAETIAVREPGTAPRQARRVYEGYLDRVGEISGSRIAPRATDVDRIGATFADGKVTMAPGTVENLADLKAAGVMGVTLPHEYGGANLPISIYTMMTEMVSRADASLQNLFGLQAICETINRFASDEQKSRLLPLFARGEVDGAMALTEPEAGSDLQSVQTTAVLDEATGRWLLNGKKRFITNGCAKVILVLARTEEGSRDGRGLSMFLLEPGPEVTINSIEDKMGIHGSPTCELIFKDAPAELVGQRRRGLTRYVMALMNGARLAISAQAVGLAEAALRTTLEYTAERHQFGKALREIVPVNEMLTRMKMNIMAGRTLLYETSRYVDLRDSYEKRAAAPDGTQDDREKEKTYAAIADVLTPISKFFNTEMCNQTCYEAIQCHGGKGYMRDKLPERYYRDARITNIYEGTSQMQVVAAIAGVKKRTLLPLVNDLLERFRDDDAADELRRAAEQTEEALSLVEADGSSEFFELAARRLVRMQTLVYLGTLLLRDTYAQPARRCLLDRYLAEYIPEIIMHGKAIRRGATPYLASSSQLLSL